MTKKNMFAVSVFSVLLFSGCYNDASQTGGNGGEGGSGGSNDSDGCSHADEGDSCNAEYAECGDLVCHCGDWLDEDDNDLDDSCDTPPDHCNAGQSCSTENATCGGLTCRCGTWGGSCGEGGSGGSGGGSGGTYTVNLKVYSNSYHVWCEGAEVEPWTDDPDGEIEWHQDWHSFGDDKFGPEMPPGDHPGSGWLTYEVNVEVANSHGLRIQCYMNRNGSETQGDNVRYTFSDPEMFTQDEYVEVRREGSLVYDLKNGDVGSGNTPDAYLAENLDPQHFSHNLQLDPPR